MTAAIITEEPTTSWAPKEYLRTLQEKAPWITDEQMAMIQWLFDKARDHLTSIGGSLPMPNGAPSIPSELDFKGQYSFGWNIKGKHHFSFEVFKDATAEWFYMDHRTKAFDGGPLAFEDDQKIPAKILKMIELLDTSA